MKRTLVWLAVQVVCYRPRPQPPALFGVLDYRGTDAWQVLAQHFTLAA